MDAAPEKPRPRRWLRWLAAAALLALVALAALVLWSRTEHALSTAVQALERASGGRLALRGVSGTLYGPLGVERLVLREAGSEAVVESLAIEWSPAALLGATLRIDRLAAKSVSLRQAGGGAANPSLPSTLRVPLRIALDDIRVERLEVSNADETLALGPLAGGLALGLTGHRLALRELGTPWARVEGEARIGAWAPFQLEGRVRLGALTSLPLDAVDVGVGGRLARVTMRVAPQARWLAGHVAAVVAPFEATPLQGLNAALTGLDLAGFNPLLPATRITLDAQLLADGARLSGPLRLENALAGPLDAGRVPLSAASGRAQLDGARLRLDDLTLVLAEAGSATGRLEVGAQGYAVELATEGLQLERLHGALRALKPAGKVRIAREADAERIEARLSQGEYALELSARLRAARLEVDAAKLRMPGGEVAASGALALDEARSFTLEARLQDFDPGRFVEMPPARLSGTLQASGALQPEWRAALAYRIADSRFAGAALSGEGKLEATARRIAVQAASLALGANRLRADGRLGTEGDRLSVELDAPRLSEIGVGASGALHAKGWIGGRPDDPAFAIEGGGRALKFKDIEAAQFRLGARAPEGLQRAFDVRAEARGLHAAGRSVAQLEATLEGTRRRHSLRASIEDPALAASLRLQGGLLEAGGWDGRLESLEAARPYAARLAEPVALRWRAGRLDAGAGRLMLAGGALQFDALVLARGMLRSAGRIERIALADLLTAPGPTGVLRTDLVVSGAWDIRAADTLSGSLQLARERGDVILAGDMPLPLEIGELRLEATARANVIEATLRGQGAQLGTLSVDLRTLAEHQAGAWRIAGDAPLSLRSRFTVPSLAWLGRLLNPELRTRGRLSGRVDVEGTLNAPRLAGELNAEQLQLRYGAAGVRLRDGEMKIELAQDKVIFHHVKFRGDEGSLTASGEARLAEGRAQLDLAFQADALAAVRRDDHQLALSGRGRVRSRDGKIEIEGEFTADRGLIELRDTDRPSLSSDVMIVGEARAAGGTPERLSLDVTLNLGKAFHVRGQGLDVRMEGSVRVTLEEGALRPRAQGRVQVAEGRYTAYGQQLAIERGVLLFDGPLDNPRLDILALRKNQRVVVGVAITGTALSPRTALYSDPPVPDAQKLQYLVFGSGPGAAGDSEFGLVSSSARPRKEEFVSFGTQLASAVYVSVGQSLRTTNSFVQATLDLTERIALQGRTGSENAITLIYTWSFD